MTSLTLITPCLPSTSNYLSECAEHVRDLIEHSAHDIRWIVVKDGPGELKEFSPPPNTAVLSTGYHRGLPTCRNIALGHARTTWVMPLDADDVVVGAGIDEICDFAGASGSAWVAGNIQLLDGRDAPHHGDHPLHFEVRELEEHWQAPFQFFPNAIVARRDAVLVAGGWPALPAAEDLGMVLALNGVYAGDFLPALLFKYRYSPRQMTRAPGYLDVKIASFAWIADCINARRERLGLPAIMAPDVRGLSTDEGLPAYWPSFAADEQKEPQQ